MTEKAKEFTRLVVSGVKPPEAYRQAYGHPDMGDRDAGKHAARLMANDGVCKKMMAMDERMDMKAVAGKQRRMEVLSAMMEGCYKEGDVRGAVACIGELNKMDGAYAPERVEAKVEERSFAAVMAAVSDC